MLGVGGEERRWVHGLIRARAARWPPMGARREASSSGGGRVISLELLGSLSAAVGARSEAKYSGGGRAASPELGWLVGCYGGQG